MPFRPRYNNKRFFFFPVVALFFVAAASGLVMLIWNKVLTEVMPVKPVSYFQAAAIFILCKILFGNFRKGNSSFQRGPQWRDKIRNMSAEERQRFRDEWRSRCNPPRKEN